MGNRDVQSLEQALQKAISETRQKISSLEALTKPIPPENSIGRISRMEAIAEKSINEASLVKARNQHQELERALLRIGSDDFGFCEECGEAIAEGRLLLMPATRHCIHCANKLG